MPSKKQKGQTTDQRRGEFKAELHNAPTWGVQRETDKYTTELAGQRSLLLGAVWDINLPVDGKEWQPLN